MSRSSDQTNKAPYRTRRAVSYRHWSTCAINALTLRQAMGSGVADMLPFSGYLISGSLAACRDEPPMAAEAVLTQRTERTPSLFGLFSLPASRAPLRTRGLASHSCESA